MKKKTINSLIGLSGTFFVAVLGWNNYLNNKELNNYITFAEKRAIFWQRKVYDQEVKFFIRLKSYNWNEILKHRDHFIVYIGTRNNPDCLNFVPKLSYAARQTGVNIYYLDTTKEMINPILHQLIQNLHIDSKPALLSVNCGKVVKYDLNQSICDFLKRS